MNTVAPAWVRAVSATMIFSNEVHIWRLFQHEAGSQIERLIETLSADEVLKAKRFYFDKDRKTFIIARGILRTILGLYLEEQPNKIRFEYTDFGKPVLAGDAGFPNISFNLSHSGNIVLYAITRDHKVGVDVERIQENHSIPEIASNFFSPNEVVKIKSADEQKRSELFYKYWTRKEAIVKALGKGISFPMQQIDTSSIENKFSTVETGQGNGEVSRFCVKDLFPAAGYAAAVASDADDFSFSYWHYLVKF